MANQKIAPGTWGSISTSQLPSGTWQAKTRYRRLDGTYNVAKASGRSANAARRNLEYRVSVLLRDRHRIGAHVTPDSTFAMLCEKWIEDANLIAAGQASTRHENIRIVRSNLIPALGEIRLREMSVSTVYAAYQAWYISTPSMARNIKGVLRKVCAFGVRLDALLFNPADQIGNFKRPDATIYAPTALELDELRDHVAAYARRPNAHGPKMKPLLLDVINTILATSARISERSDASALGSASPRSAPSSFIAWSALAMNRCHSVKPALTRARSSAFRSRTRPASAAISQASSRDWRRCRLMISPAQLSHASMLLSARSGPGAARWTCRSVAARIRSSRRFHSAEAPDPDTSARVERVRHGSTVGRASRPA